jgi:hypothetical protein
MKKIDTKDRKIWYIHQIIVLFSILWLPGLLYPWIEHFHPGIQFDSESKERDRKLLCNRELIAFTLLFLRCFHLDGDGYERVISAC